MTKQFFLIEKDILPKWFDYPEEFKILIEQKLIDFDPWVILTEERSKIRLNGLMERYPKRYLVPFARREDNDDLACFDQNKKVVVIHDFASYGNEGGNESILFWDFFRRMVEDMIEYNM